MGEILIGTSSWSDRTLIESGLFYPKEAGTPEKRLRFYAEHFPLVEVDSTYYALPSERNAALWVERTPAYFTFNVKAFSLFTQHPTPTSALPKDIREALPGDAGLKERLYQRDLSQDVVASLWQRLFSALLPLDSAGKLGVVLFQFPPWFYPNEENRRYILACKERLAQYPLAVEFRNGAWLSGREVDRTLNFLRDNTLAFVCVDEPQGFRSSVPPVVEATADVSLVRFHGRNRENWEKKGISVAERFAYLYTPEELQEWVPAIGRLASQTAETHVLMNNCYRDYAVRNAKDLASLLKAAKMPVVPAEKGPASV